MLQTFSRVPRARDNFKLILCKNIRSKRIIINMYVYMQIKTILICASAHCQKRRTHCKDNAFLFLFPCFLTSDILIVNRRDFSFSSRVFCIQKLKRQQKKRRALRFSLPYPSDRQPSFSAIFFRKSSVCIVTGSLSPLYRAARSPVI